MSDYFQYRPLNPAAYHLTRTLTLMPGYAGQPVVCTVEHLPLASRERWSYEALSYTWGDSTSTELIYCRYDDTADARTVLRVTRNCANALRRLRRPSESRCLWVDAICINQADEKDKEDQVKKMKLLYSMASRVIVYLASPASESLESVQSAVEILDYTQLFSNPWFNRVWILQEVMFAKDILVYYQDRAFSWDRLMEYSMVVNPDSLSEVQNNAKAVTLEYGMKGKSNFATSKVEPPGTPLLGLLHRTVLYNATDSRDKIIALLSMADDLTFNVRSLLTDYSPTVSTETLQGRLIAVYALCLAGLGVLLDDEPYGHIAYQSLARSIDYTLRVCTESNGLNTVADLTAACPSIAMISLPTEHRIHLVTECVDQQSIVAALRHVFELAVDVGDSPQAAAGFSRLSTE